MDSELVVSALKEWVNEQDVIPQTPDEVLKRFVNAANGDLDSCKRMLFNHYSLRVSAFKGLFEGRDIDNELLSNIRSIFQIFMVPKRTPEGYRIMICHAVSTDTKLYDMMGHMKYFIMTLESSLIDEDLSAGCVIVFDISKLSTGHILKFSPSGVKKTSNYLQEGIPLNIVSVCLVNASHLVDIMMKTVKPFINLDLIKRTFIYKADDLVKLYEKVPKECLPEEYGGALGPSTPLNEINIEKLRKIKEKFSQEEEVLKTLRKNKIF